MNILKTINLTFSYPATNNRPQNTSAQSHFGLKMAQPLSADTVSFKGLQQTVKTAGSRADSISLQTARILRNKLQKPHERLKELFLKEFNDLLSTEEKTSLLTLLDRIKSEDSMRQKTASRDWGTLGVQALLTNMTDISGFCFVLENKKSLNQFIKIMDELVKSDKVDIVEAEYHRLPPRYKKGKEVEEFNSLDVFQIQRLKDTIKIHKNPTYQFWKDVDSMSGYSGLHLIVNNKDGTYSEIQVMTRGMHNFKKVENLYYKVRNGKDVDPKYKYIAQFMKPLRPQNPDAMTEEEKALQRAVSKYTQEAYIDMLSRPFDTVKKFLKVEDATSLTKKEKEMLNDYDFNKIGNLMKACEDIAGY